MSRAGVFSHVEMAPWHYESASEAFPGPADDPTREWRKRWKKKKGTERDSPSLGKDCRQFLRGDNFQLGKGTIAGLFVRSPSAELRGVPEAISLHVIVSNFDN